MPTCDMATEMTLRVRLFGTLGKRFPDHDPLQGFDVVLPAGSRVEDLLAHLNLDPATVGIVSVNDRLVKPHAKLQDGDLVKVFRPIFGG